jgi:hypothetical protein
MICEYCKHDFKNISSFNKHLRSAKKCMIIRDGVIPLQRSCTFCYKELSSKQRLQTHMAICQYKDKNNSSAFVIIKELKNVVKKLRSNVDLKENQGETSQVQRETSQVQRETSDIVISETKNLEIEIDKVGYNYLIQEREHLMLNQQVFKTGMSVQFPNNQIDRLKQGYKKGSKILFIACCKPEEARERETKIKNELKKKFKNHTDGIEHFIGDYKEMMRIMMDICCV